MRRALAILLIVLGAFGGGLAFLLPAVAVPAVKKTPLNLDITQVSSGPGKLLDAASGTSRSVQLRATRIVRTDSHASDGTNTTVNESLCIVVVQGTTPNCLPSNDPRLLSITTDRVTSERKSAESVHVANYRENVNGDTSARHAGVTYKWPIDAQRKTYQFYEPDLLKAFPATYEGTSKVAGLTVYQYTAKTGDQPYLVQGLFKGTYNDVTTVYVEPKTGAIVDGVEHQVQTLQDGTVALDTTLRFDQSAIDYQANYSKDAIDKLRLAGLWIPIIAGILGVLALVAGVVLVLRGHPSSRSDGGAHRDNPPPADPNVGPPPSYADSSQA